MHRSLRWNLAAAVLLLAALAGVAVVAAGRRARPGPPVAPADLLQTARYSLEVTEQTLTVPVPRIRGGGLASLGGGRHLLLTGDGRFHALSWTADDSLGVQALTLRLPANPEEFAAAVAPGMGRAGDAPHWFRAGLGLETEVSGESVRIFGSYLYWLAEARCYVMRVAVLETTLPALLADNGGTAADWRVRYESAPCLAPGVHRFSDLPLMGHETGGQLARLGGDSLLLALGHAGFDGMTLQGDPLPRDPAASWGKTILISLSGRPARTFTLGHRNPQGLLRDATGTTWLAEHGPRGGDELNLLAPGRDYGWPVATYGTDYGSLQWPGVGTASLTAPLYAWVPSIAVSDLIRIEGEAFEAWRGDLLVGSLTDRALHRVRLENGRVAYVERIPLGRRVRSLLQADGRLLIWTDEYLLMTLRPNRGTTGEHLFALHCASCHAVADGRRHLIGPDLAGVVGRPVGSVGEPSEALRNLGGTWTPDRLTSFLASPQGMVPGTRMSFPGLGDAAARQAILRYLGGRR